MDQVHRKPILTSSCRRNARNQPEFLNTEVLLERFTPLLKSIHRKFCAYDGLFTQRCDIEDLWSQIVLEFLRLVQSYDPKRGVDFPGYIAAHLQQRVYHYVTKVQKQVLKESTLRAYPEEDKLVEFENLVDESAERDIRRAEAIASIPWERVTESQAELIKEVLYNKKPIETIAKERRVSIKSVVQQLDEVCEWLFQIYHEGAEHE